ncbi:MAG: sigma-70 family RNA polymerase sigma factor [Actinomycetota bacterium]|nr:sigma-70 family RNA polymerase sigma factor [Actinomycetota bacterium]
MGTGVTEDDATATAARAAPAERPAATFDDVFRREHPRVVRLVYAMTRSNDVAQDVAQEAFARLLERWATVSSPEGFVRTTAVNRVRDRERHRVVRRRVLRSLERREPATSELDYLADALAELPAKRRAMVVLRFYEQRSVDEIAEILDVRPGTVKSGLSRSLRQLKEALS